MNPDDIRTLIASRKWYHAWEIVPGIATPGRCIVNPREILTTYGISEQLDGMRALDIGAYDGVYSFELERRGANVISLDIQDPDETGYNVAKEILGSKCEHIQADVCKLGGAYSPIVGDFDLILYMGVYYHIKEPMRAWEAIKSVMKPSTMLYFEGEILDFAWLHEPRLVPKHTQIEAVRDMPIAYFAAGAFAGDETNWSIPTMVCLHDWLIAAGYEVLRMAIVEETSRCWGVARLKEER